MQVSKREIAAKEKDRITIIREKGTKEITAPSSGFGFTKITWRDGKISQVEKTETEK